MDKLTLEPLLYPPNPSPEGDIDIWQDNSGVLYRRRGSQAPAILSSPDGIVAAGKTVIVDATNGNDGTGARGRLDLPFLTLIAAKNIAISGDLVYVRPGAYTVANADTLLKNSVNWHFDAGASVSKTITTGEVGVFDDLGAAVTSDISGEGVFLLTGAATGEFAYLGCVHTEHASTNLTIHARSIGTTQGATHSNSVMAIRAGHGTVRIECSETIFGTDNSGVADTGIAVYWEHGFLTVKAPQIYATHNVIQCQADGSAVENMYVEADEIYSMGTTVSAQDAGVIYTNVFSSNPNAACWITADTITANIGSVYTTINAAVDAANKIYVRASKLFGQLKIASGLNYVTATKIEAIGNVSGSITALFAKVTGGTLRYNIGHHEPKAFTGIGFDVTGGTVISNGIEYTSGSGSSGMTMSGGAATLIGATIDTSANSTPDSISVSAGTLTLRNSVVISESGKKDIVQSGGGVVNVSGGYGSGTSGHFDTTGSINILTPA